MTKIFRLILVTIAGLLTFVVAFFWAMTNGSSHRIPASTQFGFALLLLALLTVFILALKWIRNLRE
jgi:hypothetical protein